VTIEPVSLGAVEDALLARLKDRRLEDGTGLRVDEFDIQRDFDDLRTPVQVASAIEDLGLRRVTNEVFTCEFTVMLYVAFKSVRGDRARRRGTYPLVMSIIAILSGQDLGMDIEELQPGRAQEIFHQTLRDKGYIGWKIPLKSSFDFEVQRPEDAGVALMKIALDLYMQPDDGQVDATNLISVRE
jgi:hypothetical protein